jgi:radical SAM superfamily enzyme YgiQ (UPF0313 family)
MKIKFIIAPQTNPDPYWKPLPPLGVATLYSYLKQKGIDVDQDDLDIKTLYGNRESINRLDRLNLKPFREKEKVEKWLLNKSSNRYLEYLVDKLLSKTDYKGFDVICISMAIRAHQLLPALCLAKKIKQETGAIIILGGRRIYPEILKDYDFIDYGILEDTGDSLFKLLQYIQGNDSINLNQISNLMYRKNQKVRIGPKYEFHMNKITYPDYTGLPIELYKYHPYKIFYNKFPKKSILILPGFIINGCRGNCAFCSGNQIKVQSKDPKKISKDIIKLKKEFKTKYFMFMSNEVNISYDYTLNLAKELKKCDILWCDSARLDVFDKKLIKEVSDSGCIHLTYGLESGSQELLDKMNKGVDVNKASRILKWAHNANIWSHINVIAGLPYETDDDIKKTINYLNENSDYINSLTITKYFVAYNSPIEKNPEKFGLKLRKETQTRFSNVKFESFVFDEINGLKWEQKQKQQEKAVEMIVKGYKKKARAVVSIPILFYLYDVLNKDIEKIQEIVNEYNLLKPYGRKG